MFLFRCEARCDEAMGFPPSVRPAVQDIVAAVRSGEWHAPSVAFTVNMEGEALHIPYRVYYDPALLRRQLGDAQGSARRILLCLGTRHYDGYLRQACLRELVRHEAPWCMPYVVQLAGEYVVEIAEDVANAMDGYHTATLRAFAFENRAYLATLARRVTSYWDYYYRRTYPERHAYPGARVLAALDAAVLAPAPAWPGPASQGAGP